MNTRDRDDQPARRFEAGLVRQLADCWLAEGDKVMALLSVRSVSDLRAGVGLPEDYWPGLVERQAEVLLPWLNEVASAGLEGGAQTVGAKRKGQKDGPELLINWELVNQQAADWAETYGYDLVRGITETTQKQLQAAINAWIESGETFPKLVKRVNGIFDNKRRAKLIAATEATRAYAQANTIAWRDAGAWGREWRTAVDELVCPRCGGLHRQRAELGKAFAGGIDSPPAHPGCRCSLVPVVFEGGKLPEKPEPMPMPEPKKPGTFATMQDAQKWVDEHPNLKRGKK